MTFMQIGAATQLARDFDQWMMAGDSKTIQIDCFKAPVADAVTFINVTVHRIMGPSVKLIVATGSGRDLADVLLDIARRCLLTPA